MKRKLNIAATVLLFSTILLLATPALIKPVKAQGVTLEIIVSDQQYPAVQGMVSAFLASNYSTGVDNVTVVASGTRSNDQLQYLVTQMTAGSTEFDVLGLDTIWPAQFATNNWVVELGPLLMSNEMDNYVSSLVDAATYDGKLWAYPYFANLGVLYYRADILARNGFDASDITTWEGLNTTANAILNNVTEQHLNPNLVGYIGQFDAYEGGTCNFLEFLGANGMTSIFDSSGNPDLTNQKAVDAMNFVYQLIAPRYSGVFNNTYIVPRDGLVSDEGSSIGLWTAGNAIFMRQWTFGYGSSMTAAPINATVGGNYTQFAVAPIPHFAGATGYKTSEIGGAVLAISAYSEHKTEALNLIRFLGQQQAQLYELTSVSNFPALLSAYNSLPSGYGWAKDFLPALDLTLARPISPKYADMSNEMAYYFSNIISGKLNATYGLTQMNDAIKQIISGPPTAIPGTSIPVLMLIVTSTIGLIIIRKRKQLK